MPSVMGPPDSWRGRRKIERYEGGRLTNRDLSPQSLWALRRSSALPRFADLTQHGLASGEWPQGCTVKATTCN
jgi:hypothetical protein